MCPLLLSAPGAFLVETHAVPVLAALILKFICALPLLCLEGVVIWCPPYPLALRFFPLLLKGSLRPAGKDLM